MRKHRKHFDDETEVDMTPMLDIVFIMLIFFIVTTSFVKEQGIVLNRPALNQPDTPPDPKNRPIVIAINDISEVTVAGRVIDVNAVRANVETQRAKKPKAMVIVQAHESAKTGVVVTAVDQARLAGVEKVTVVKPTKK